MYVFMYIFLFIHSLTPRLLWLFVVIKKLQNFLQRRSRSWKWCSCLHCWGFKPPGGLGSFCVICMSSLRLHGMSLQTRLHLIFYIQHAVFWIFFLNSISPPRNDTLMRNMFQEPSVTHGLTGIKHDYPSLTYNCIAFILTCRHVPSSLGASGAVQGTFCPFGKHGNKNTVQIGSRLTV